MQLQEKYPTDESRTIVSLEWVRELINNFYNKIFKNFLSFVIKWRNYNCTTKQKILCGQGNVRQQFKIPTVHNIQLEH